MLKYPYKAYMTPKERRTYQVSRAILAAAPDGARVIGGLEWEVSEQMRRDHGPGFGGLTIPPEVIFGDPDLEKRQAMEVGSAAAGGYLVGGPTGGLIDALYPQSVVLRLGGRIEPEAPWSGLYPLAADSNEAEWLNETESPSSNHRTSFGGVAVTPHRLYTQRFISKQLLLQGGLGDSLAGRLLMGAFGAAIDRATLVGLGNKQPLGLLNDSLVATVEIGANGGVPARANLTAAEGVPIAAGVFAASPGWVVSPGARERLKGTANDSGYLLETDGGVDQVNGFVGYATAYMPDTGAKGSGTSLGSAIFGADWSMLSVLLMGGLDVLTNNYTYADSGLVQFAVQAHADILKARPEAWAKIVDVEPV